MFAYRWDGGVTVCWMCRCKESAVLQDLFVGVVNFVVAAQIFMFFVFFHEKPAF